MPNKLIQEKSPYLLQHAHNPVDWFPWSDEAFQKAKSEDKPIFLSIGYSTCHWCHVMAHESFEDTEVAKLLNKNYIAIKVDREERPDIDNIYMSVCQALTGSGGWPLTIFMTPDRKPFYAGTYFPKESRMGYAGLMELLDKISTAWNQERKALIDSSDTIMKHMQDDFDAVHEGDISMEHIHQAFNTFAKSFDQVFGGFGQAPKFPTPHNLSFLLRYWKTTGDSDALKMVEKTLESMYRGGIYDHIGFGFSRYSTDRKWLVPHFEKMLYDNALIAIACLETYLATGNKTYWNIAEKTFEYVLRDMTDPEGGFYSAEDADSEKEEGKFYIWTPEELVQVLGDADAKTFCAYYDITAQGNFEGKGILNLIHNQSSFEDLFNNPIEAMRARVYDARQKRIHPYKDDKILTAWNGLMIAALSMGSRIMNNKSYLKAAQNAVSFIDGYLRRKDGRLLARYRDGEASYPAYLEDYAFLVWGLIELYEASFEAKYLKLALELNDDMIKYFYDEKNSGFFIYGSDSEQLIARPKDVYDGALPSGNSVAAMNLLRLARMTGSSELEDKALRQFEAFGGKVSKYPVGYSHFMMALLFAYSKGTEIVISGTKEDKGTESMFKLINSHFMPYSVWLMNDIGEKDNGLTELAPFVADQRMTDNKATAYICENFACKAPITDIEQFSQMLYK